MFISVFLATRTTRNGSTLERLSNESYFFHNPNIFLFSLLGLGYTLDELMAVSDEGRKIRESRQRSMRGNTWNQFVNVFELAAKGVLDGATKGLTSRRTSLASLISFPTVKMAKSA